MKVHRFEPSKTSVGCDLCERALSHPVHEMTVTSNKHKGDVMERREHSPLPWTVGRGDRIEAANGRVVADMTFSSYSERQAPANAELIVQAVNQHTTLAEQRDLLAAALTAIRDSYWSENEPYAMRVDQLQDIARAALATVEQGEGREL